MNRSNPLMVVADADAELRDNVAGFMSARGYQVEAAHDAAAASGLLQRHRVDVLLFDLALRDPAGTDVLTLAKQAAPWTRCIATSTNSAARERDAALRLGAVRVLAKPLSLLELADAVALARDCAEGFHGWMHRVSMIDVLQMYHHAGQSVVLNIQGDQAGTVAFRDGDLIHAETGALTGIDALTALLKMTHGRFETAVLGEQPRTLSAPFDHLLLDSLRALDEERRTDDGDGDDDALMEWDGVVETPLPADHDGLVRWCSSHAPGAGLWVIQPSRATIDRLDVPGLHPEFELAGTPGAIGWAYELAELGDPGWTRVELTAGSTAISLFRRGERTIALGRLVTGDAIQRRFRIECAQLARWLDEKHGGAP